VRVKGDPERDPENGRTISGVGGVVDDRYELLEVLGRGGITEVVQAIDRRQIGSWR
jgi:hypothetical protein